MKITLNILDKKIIVKEPSFTDYKSLLKNLTTDDDTELVFDNFIKENIGNNNFDILEKFLILLNLRGLVLGNEYNITVEKENYSINLDAIIEKFSEINNIYEIDINGKKYGFGYVDTFNFKPNKIDFITDSFKYLNGKLLNISNEEKSDILPAMNFVEVYDNIIKQLYKDSIELKFINEEVFLYNCLPFLKSIFETDLLEFYKLEYVCRKVLNFGFNDFNNISVPECRILLNYHVEDVKKENDRIEQLKNR